MDHAQREWTTPGYAEIKMDAEIGSYQEDMPRDVPSPIATHKSSPRQDTRRRATHRFAALLGGLLFTASVPNAWANGGLAVLTSRVASNRNSWNPLESTLVPPNFGPGNTFHLANVLQLPGGSGQLVAQPLYIPNVTGTYNGMQQTKDLLVLATTGAYVFVFDANPPYESLLAINLSTSDPAYPGGTSPPCNPDGGNATQKYNGVTGTPAITVAANGDQILYLVDKAVPKATQTNCVMGTQNGPPQGTVFRLWAIDLNTGRFVFSPTKITAHSMSLSLDPTLEDQRPGLLVWGGNKVFIGFGGMPNDFSGNTNNPYHGWVVAYNALTGAQLWSWVSSPALIQAPSSDSYPFDGRGQMGGLWQGGNGIMIAPNAYSILFATGNGDNQSLFGATDYGDSLVALNINTGAVSATYTPSNAAGLYFADADYGSAGPVASSYFTFVHAGKDGLMRNFDQNYNLLQGPFHATFNNYDKCIPRIEIAGDPSIGQLARFYGGPAYWNDGLGNGTYFVWGSKDFPRAYPYKQALGNAFFSNVRYNSPSDPSNMQITYCDDTNCSKNCTTASNYAPPLINPPSTDEYHVADNTPGPVLASDGMPGGMLALSGVPTPTGQGGILWAATTKSGDAEFSFQFGVLYAFDGQSMKLLWSNASDPTQYLFAPFNPPTVTNGRVYLPAMIDFGERGPAPNQTMDSEVLIYSMGQ